MDPRTARDARERETLRASSVIGRIAAIVALGVAAVAVALLLFGGGSKYTVTAEFENASQLVKGSQVVVGGVAAGSVKDIALGDHGQALVTFTVSDPYAPLKQGTTVQIRSYSLSGVANRQVQLTLPPASAAGAEIPDGATLPSSVTTSEVDLDQLFNTLNARTIRNFKHVIEGFEISYEGVSEQANTGWRYLNPFLSTSRRLFGELTRDTPALEHLIVDTSHLSGALARRAPDLSLLIHNSNLMMGALADLDPLINASKPVARKLGPFFHTFRAAAHDAVPTITDLDRIVRRPGSQNDLVELTRDAVPLARAAIGSGAPDCGQNPATDYLAAADDDYTQGAFGETVCSLRNGLPSLAFFRPYTTELTGWFNDFGPGSGIYDANGGIGRIATTFNTFSASPPNLGAPESPLQQIASTVSGGLYQNAKG